MLLPHWALTQMTNAYAVPLLHTDHPVLVGVLVVTPSLLAKPPAIGRFPDGQVAVTDPDP
jgi:hypothetical protein